MPEKRRSRGRPRRGLPAQPCRRSRSQALEGGEAGSERSRGGFCQLRDGGSREVATGVGEIVEVVPPEQ